MSTSFQMFLAMSNVVPGLTADHFGSRLTVLLELCVPSSLACWLVSRRRVDRSHGTALHVEAPQTDPERRRPFAARIYLIGAPEPMSIEGALAAPNGGYLRAGADQRLLRNVLPIPRLAPRGSPILLGGCSKTCGVLQGTDRSVGAHCPWLFLSREPPLIVIPLRCAIEISIRHTRVSDMGPAHSEPKRTRLPGGSWLLI